MVIPAAHHGKEDSRRTERVKVPRAHWRETEEGDKLGRTEQNRKEAWKDRPATREATSKQSGMWRLCFGDREGEAVNKGRMTGRVAMGEDGPICSLQTWWHTSQSSQSFREGAGDSRVQGQPELHTDPDPVAKINNNHTRNKP